MITKVNNTISNLKNLWVEMFLNKTDKVSNIADGSVLNAMAFGTAKVAQKAIKDIAIVEAQIFPTSATGEYLDKAAALYGVSPRKQALGSSTYVRVSAEPGTQYEVGTTFLAKNGIRFVVDKPYTVDNSGYGYVSVRSTITGSATNVEANSIVQVSPRPLTHIECTNEYAAIGGRDYEDDVTFRNRIINYNNKLSEETMESWTQIFQDLDPRILKVMNVGLGEDGKTHIYLVTQNGSFFTDDELETLLQKATPYFGLTELNLQGEAVGVVLENAKWMFVGGNNGVDFRVELSSDTDIATVRKNIQIAMTKYLDFRFWDAGKAVQWDDLLQVVKSSEGVKYVPDEYFFPYYDEEVPLNMLPRIKGFRMRDLEGNILYDSGSNLSNIFYPAGESDIYKGSQTTIASQKYLVSFTVTNTKNIPVPNAYITIGNKVIATDVNGTANVLLENGEYQYTLNKANWDQKTGEFVVLNGPIYITINDFTATPYLVSFTVYEGNAPLAEASIQISTSNLLTNNEGQASIQLEPGTYTYTISKAGFKTIESILTIENQPVEIIERMFLETLPVYFAVVDRERSVYVPEANIQVIDQSKLTDIEGQAELGLQVGEYEVKVDKEGYQQYKKNIVVQGEDPNCVVIEMVAIPYEVKFTILDAEYGRPISGATIKINDSTYLADDQGVAIISLPNGTFEYTVFKSGYMSYSDFLVVEDAPISKIISLEKAFYTFRLIVRDIENGNYIQGAEVVCEDITTVTNVNGVANITLGNGTYTFIINARNYKKYTGEVEIKDQDVVLTVYIELRDTVITYTATDELTGNPIKDVLIELTNVGTGLIVDSGTTNAIGVLDLAAEAGNYSWRATHNFYLPVTSNITLEKLKDQEVPFIMKRKEITNSVLVTENIPNLSGDATTVRSSGSNTIEVAGTDEYIYIANVPTNLIIPNSGAEFDLNDYVRTFRRLKEGGVDEPYDFIYGGARLNYNTVPAETFITLDGSQATVEVNPETRDVTPRSAAIDVTVTTGDNQITASIQVDQKRSINYLPVKEGLKINVKSTRDNTVKQYTTNSNGIVNVVVMPGVQYELTVAESGFYENDGLFISTWDFINNPTVEMGIIASKQLELRAKQANTLRPLSDADVSVTGMSLDQTVITNENGIARIYISPVTMNYSAKVADHTVLSGRFTPPLQNNYLDLIFQYSQINFELSVLTTVPYEHSANNCSVSVTSLWGGTTSQQYTFTGTTDDNGDFNSSGNGQFNIPPGEYRITIGSANNNYDIATKDIYLPLDNPVEMVAVRRTISVTATIKEILPLISSTANPVKAGLVLSPFYVEKNTSSGSNLTTNANGQVTKTVYAGLPERFAIQPVGFYEGEGDPFTLDYSNGATQNITLTYTCSKRIPVHVSSDLYGDLERAQVTFTGMSVDQIQETNNAGIAYIYLSPVSMNYTIRKQYYNDLTGSLTPTGQETKLEFTLEAKSYPVKFTVSTGGILPPENIIVRITNTKDESLVYEGTTDIDGVANIPNVLTGTYQYSVLAGEVTTGVFDHPQTEAGTELEVEVQYELINAQIEVRELYGSSSVFAALSNKTLTMNSKAGEITISLDENGTAVMTLIKGLEYTFTVDDYANFYSNPTQSYTWTEDGFVWNMNLNVTAQITLNVKDTYSNVNISGANIQYNLQTKTTDSSGNAVFYRSALTKDYSVTKDDYRTTTGNIEATNSSPIAIKLFRELQSVTINVKEAIPNIEGNLNYANKQITYTNAAGNGTLTLNDDGAISFKCYLGIPTTFAVIDHPNYYSNSSQSHTFATIGESWTMILTCSTTLVVHVEANVPAGEPLPNASVTYFNQTKTTNTDGNATFYRSGLNRNISVSADFLESYSGLITSDQVSPIKVILTRAANPVKIHVVESIPGVTGTWNYASKKINWSAGSAKGTLTLDSSGNATFNGYLGTEMTFTVVDNANFYNNSTQVHTFNTVNENWNMTLTCSAQITVNVKSNAPSANLSNASVTYFNQTKTTGADGNVVFYRSGLDKSITSTVTYHANYSGTITPSNTSPFNIVMSRNQATVSIKVVETIPNIAGTNVYASKSLTMTKNGSSSKITLDINGATTVTTYLGIPTTFAVVDHSNYYSNPSQSYTYTSANQTFNMSLACSAQITVNVKSNVPANTNISGASLTYFNQTKTTDGSGNAVFYRSGLDKPINGSATYFNAYIGTVTHGQSTPYNITFTRTTVTVTLTVMEKLGTYTGAFLNSIINRTVLGAVTELTLDESGRKSNTVYAGLTYSYTPKANAGYYSNGTQTHVWTKEGETWTMTMTSNTQFIANVKSSNYGWNISGVSATLFGQTVNTDSSGNATVYRGGRTPNYSYSFSKSLYNTASGSIPATQASPWNVTLSETSSSITITIKDNYQGADKGNANGCPVKLTNKNKTSITFSGNTNSSGQVSFGPMIQGTYTLSWGGGTSYWGAQSVDITMPTASIQKSAVRLTKNVTLIWYFRVPTQGSRDFYLKAGGVNLFKPVYTTAGVATTITLGIDRNSNYVIANYTFIAGLNTTMGASNAYFVTGTTTTHTMYNVTPTYNFSNVTGTKYFTAIKALTLTVQNSLTNANVSGATVTVYGIDGSNATSASAQNLTTNSNGQTTVYVSGLTNRYVISASRYDTLNTTNANTTNFTLKLVPSEMNLTINVKRSDNTSLVAASCIVKLSNNNSAVNYSGTTNASGQLVLKIRPGNYWTEAGGSTAWGGIGTNNFPVPNRSGSAVSFISDQSITLYALYISSSGWFAPVTSKSIDVENINNYYTGLQGKDKLKEGTSSFGYYFDNHIDYRGNSQPMFSVADFGRSGISINLGFCYINEYNEIILDRSEQFHANSNKVILRGKLLVASNQINSMVAAIGCVSSSDNQFSRSIWMVYKGTGYKVQRTTNFSSSTNLLKAYSSYTLQNAIYWGQWKGSDNYIGSYSANPLGYSLTVGYILSGPNYGTSGEVDISLGGIVVNFLKAILIETETVTSGTVGIYAKIVLLGIHDDRSKTLYYVKIRCYNSGSVSYIQKVGDIVSYKSVNRPMGANLWFTTDRKWMFFPPSGDSFYPKGINSYYANGQQLIVDGSTSMPDDVSYLNSSHTSAMRSALQNVYVLEILFNKTQTKMIVLTNTTGAAFEIGDFEGNYNPDAMYCFQLVNNSWVQISTQAIDRQNVLASYNSTGNQGIKYKSSLSLCDKSNDLGSLAMFGSQYSFNWAFPANSKPIVFYTSKITWGE